MDRHQSWVFTILIALGLVAFVGLPLATGFAATLDRGSDRVVRAEERKHREEQPDRGRIDARRGFAAPWAQRGRPEMKRDRWSIHQLDRSFGCWRPGRCDGERGRRVEHPWRWDALPGPDSRRSP